MKIGTVLLAPTTANRLHACVMSSSRAGGCNFCDRAITSHGARSVSVVRLSGGGLQARLCEDCAVGLAESIMAMFAVERL